MPAMYIPVANSDTNDDANIDNLRAPGCSWLTQNRKRVLSISVLILLCSGIGFLAGYYMHHVSLGDAHGLYEKLRIIANTVDYSPVNNMPARKCENPSVRREWRSLSQDEKQNYIDAVNCLAKLPSIIRENGTLYDDFPWVHNQISHMTHGSAQFFSWHRYFVHAYETALHSYCHYNGSFPYWDWTLDWEDLRSAPIWSPTLGFGGDGDLNSPETVGHGRCVTDGAFAHLKPLFYASHYQPHCLSRGFSEFSGINARPEAVEEIMNQNEYEKFFLAVENGPHNVVPVGVRGDFYSFTAPYDPVFFLHHAQLDRLWWLWQQGDIPRRLSEYHGRASTNGTIGATLQDVLTLKGLMSDISVSDIMDTEGGYLCYRY